MDPKLKKTLSAFFIILSVAAVFCIAFGNPELSDAWDTLRGLDARWIAGLFFCWACYAFSTRWEHGSALENRDSGWDCGPWSA